MITETWFSAVWNCTCDFITSTAAVEVQVIHFCKELQLLVCTCTASAGIYENGSMKKMEVHVT